MCNRQYQRQYVRLKAFNPVRKFTVRNIKLGSSYENLHRRNIPAIRYVNHVQYSLSLGPKATETHSYATQYFVNTDTDHNKERSEHHHSTQYV